MLPQRFLDIPKHGTLNIHPSLLPLWRGAAPVNRCLENGDAETGVSLAFTVLACDAGPVLAQEVVQLGGDEQAPELLHQLFALGGKMLVKALPEVWSGEAEKNAQPQDAQCATHAAKMSKAEAVLDFSQPALKLHNKVRGFAGWPGTSANVLVREEGKSDVALQLRVLRTRQPSAHTEDGAPSSADAAASGQHASAEAVVHLGTDAVRFRCGDGLWLEALEVQAPSKKACSASAFRNGMAANGRQLLLNHQDSA